MQDYIEAIKSHKISSVLGVSYSAILYLPNAKNSIKDIKYASSNNEWGDLYYKSLIVDCPLVKQGRRLVNDILPWDFVTPLTSQEFSVINSRREFRIFQGISFISTTEDAKYSIALGSDYKSKDFYSELIKRKFELNKFISEILNGLHRSS